MPRSPCKAFTVCSMTLVEPVLVSVAAIFWPTLPDLPIPTTTILPRWRSALTTRSTARSNAASSCARTALRPASSMSKTSRARFRWLMRRRGCQRGWRLSMAKPLNRAEGRTTRAPASPVSVTTRTNSATAPGPAPLPTNCGLASGTDPRRAPSVDRFNKALLRVRIRAEHLDEAALLFQLGDGFGDPVVARVAIAVDEKEIFPRLALAGARFNFRH